MKQFYSTKDVYDLEGLLQTISSFKQAPHSVPLAGQHKSLAMLFFNPSLRTRMSTERAATNLGMDVITMNMKDSWAWELEEGQVMDADKAEHVREAAGVISSYADIVAIRSFPGLKDKKEDDRDALLSTFIKHCSKPVINLESSLRHPLQSLTDLFTIREHMTKKNPKIVLSWAPHPKALPHTVALSFLEWMRFGRHQVVVTHPEGYELDPSFMKGHSLEYDRDKAFENADFIYVKNWSAANPYGKVLNIDKSRMITLESLKRTRKAKLMHCLPVRRNMVISDDAMDSNHSIIQQQAKNRLHTAQAVIYHLLTNMQT